MIMDRRGTNFFDRRATNYLAGRRSTMAVGMTNTHKQSINANFEFDTNGGDASMLHLIS